MGDNGEEKLIAVARHIAKTLGHTDNTADDILQIFSSFDGRLREKLTTNDEEHHHHRSSVDQTLKSLDRQISRYLSSDRPIWSDSADSSAFLDVIDDLVSSIRDWTSMAADKPVASALDRAEDLLQQAMFRLEDEFKSLMERGGESLDLTRYSNGINSDDEDDEDDSQIPIANPIGSDYNIIIDALPSGTINDLHEIAKRMASAGYSKECAQAYSVCRREFLEESICRLGIHKFSTADKMAWSNLEEEIERWIKAVNVALRILLPSERRLCDRVFFNLSALSHLSFIDVSRPSTLELLHFADAVAIGSRAPERLYKVLDLFEALRDLIPDFQALFSDDHYSLLLFNEAVNVWKRLGEAIRGIFMELENLIRRDPAKAAVPGGGIHPITRYVMNYIRVACQSRQTLEQVFEESIAPPVDRPPSSSSPLSVQMAWMMELLESNLEAKSKIYKDPALASVFMMNNGRYIVHKVKDSELGSLLGDDWIRKHAAKVRQYHVNYQRNSWSKVLGVLKLDSTSLSPNVASKTMKEKLKLFNVYFDEICKTQSTWVIVDVQLREELRASVAGSLTPAYRNFIGRLQTSPDVGRQTDKHVKYSDEDLEARINDLFRGSGVKK